MSKSTVIVTIAAIAAVGAGAWYFTNQSSRSSAPSAPQREVLNTGTPYDEIAKMPDWSGAWLADEQPSILQTDAAIPLTTTYAAKLAELRAGVKAGGPLPDNSLCRPEGLPLYMSHVGPLYEFVFAPGHVFMNSESMRYRDIHTDGRALPNEPQIDQFNGYSVGHWDGDTLVVETTGILEDALLFPGIENGGGLKITEKIRLIGPDKLQDEITLTSAKALTQPYTYTTTLTRHREWTVSEYVCITDSHAVYPVKGFSTTPEEDAASTTRKPPVRQRAQPAANAVSLPGGTWASISKLPDLTGYWSLDNHPNEQVSREYVPLTDERHEFLLALYKVRDAQGDAPSDVYHCRPRGAPQMWKAAGAGWFFGYMPGQVTVISNNGQSRRFYTDGRPHPENLELSFNGHSIAHWEGDTLKADTVGFRPEVQMFYGMPSGPGMRMEEQIHPIGPDKIEMITTQYSKVALLAPWTYNRTATRHRDWDSLEDYCSQNNRDVHPETGMQQFDLTPPPEEPAP